MAALRILVVLVSGVFWIYEGWLGAIETFDCQNYVYLVIVIELSQKSIYRRATLTSHTCFSSWLHISTHCILEEWYCWRKDMHPQACCHWGPSCCRKSENKSTSSMDLWNCPIERHIRQLWTHRYSNIFLWWVSTLAVISLIYAKGQDSTHPYSKFPIRGGNNQDSLPIWFQMP